MKTENYQINQIPSVLYGEPSEKCWLFVHGQGGNKEEAAVFSEIAVPAGYQVLGVDLPEHGARKGTQGIFDPWTVVPELQTVMAHMKSHWTNISLRANSIGAYFSMLAFADEPIEKALLVSPMRMRCNNMKQRSGEKIKLLSVDDLLGVPTGDPITEIEVEKISPFEGHPFKVKDDEKMKELVESILGNGVLTPVIVRPDDEGGYEMISGHRRLFAVKEIGLDTIPAYVREMTDDDAVIAMVDCNIQREEILPSEKAFAYRMKLDAIKHQGKVTRTSSQVGRKLEAAEIIAESVGESKNQIHRFVRLTEVIPELLDLIDRGNIAIMTGVDISYLEEKMQKWLYEYIKDNGVIKSYQISALRDELNMNGNLSRNEVIQILKDYQMGRKPAMRINFTSNQLRKYFPAYYSSQEAKAVIEKLLGKWKKEQDKKNQEGDK